MIKRSHILLAFTLGAAALGAGAQSMQPGLWEISNKMSSSSGEMERAMAEAQKELAAMPPDQRKMMESMMAKQGMGMGPGAGGATAIKICITPEMAQNHDVSQQQGDCKHTRSPLIGNSMKFSFVCAKPPSSGEGQVTFVSPQAYSMKMKMTHASGGKSETMNMDASGKFLAADCGSIRPIVMPKK